MAGLYSRDATSDAVAAVDGYGVTMRVDRGHLVISDGVGRHRRERRYSRGQRTLRRVVVLGQAGVITIEALRWCNDIGVPVICLDVDGRVLSISQPHVHDDARLRRAQALAPTTDTGLAATRYLLGAKLAGQSNNAAAWLKNQQVAGVIDTDRELLASASLTECRDLEAHAANSYFGAWRRVTATFATRDRDRLPTHWTGFSSRATPLLGGKTPRNAADPINALLNYCYALLEAEATLACAVIGLDPGLGILHSDKKNRDSLALDLMEAVRPDVDRYLLELLLSHTFSLRDFHETRDGRCRVLAPLTHTLASNLPAWGSHIAPYAEGIARIIASGANRSIKTRTPLTQANMKSGQRPSGHRSAKQPPGEARPPRACIECGLPVADYRRRVCPRCAPADQARRGREQMLAIAQRRAEARAVGDDPSNSPDARLRRHTSQKENREQLRTWSAANPGHVADPAMFEDAIRPGLTDVPLSRMQAATGLSLSACSRIRSGALVPHARHWESLEALGKGELPT